MRSLLKILPQMTGLQKLGVARNLIVLSLLLLSFTQGAVAAQTSAAPNASLPSLCMTGESTVWTGAKDRKIFSLCASNTLGPAKGYMQYRAGTAGSAQFKYPKTLENPHGIFSYSEGAHSSEVDFSNGRYSYAIFEQADSSETDINITFPSGKASTIVLDKASNTIGQNSTSDLFQKLGLSP